MRRERDLEAKGKFQGTRRRAYKSTRGEHPDTEESLLEDRRRIRTSR
jgi:hypothetical protein